MLAPFKRQAWPAAQALFNVQALSYVLAFPQLFFLIVLFLDRLMTEYLLAKWIGGC